MEGWIMNENPRGTGSSPGAASSGAVLFVLGAVVGAGVALLLAPRTGRETRRRLSEAGGRLSDVARRKVHEARVAARELGRDARSEVAAALREASGQDSGAREPRPKPLNETQV
jgi:hypothetical protein